MVDLFVKLIIQGRKTINDVPQTIKEAVILKLKEFGYSED